MRGHFAGKIVLNNMLDVKVADVEFDGIPEKCVIIPMKRNDIIMWNDELQYWFRAFAFRNPRGRFTHFMMKFIPRKSIKRMSASQIEAFANHSIGAIINVDYTPDEETPEQETEKYILENI